MLAARQAFCPYRLLAGAPGVGRSRDTRGLTTILPVMRVADALDTTRRPRVAGRTDGRTALVTRRPCRAPHQPRSAVGRSGGGQLPRPGEGSRAHPGVRCLDELPEFRRHVLEMLRQPLVNGITDKQSGGRFRLYGSGHLSGAGGARHPKRGVFS
jgi:magnesium chelatase family protein